MKKKYLITDEIFNYLFNGLNREFLTHLYYNNKLTYHALVVQIIQNDRNIWYDERNRMDFITIINTKVQGISDVFDEPLDYDWDTRQVKYVDKPNDIFFDEYRKITKENNYYLHYLNYLNTPYFSLNNVNYHKSIYNLKKRKKNKTEV